MSVTFTVSNAPRTEVPCPYCQEAGVEYPEGNGYGGKCDHFCPGFYWESASPRVNYANGNAAAILRLLGFREEVLCGSCSAADLRQRILRARNADRSALVREAEFTPGGHAGVKVSREGNVLSAQRMGAALYDGANTDADTLRRIAGLENLALWAQENGYSEITWG